MGSHLLILGAGQYGTVVHEIARSMGYFEKVDFLDDRFGETEQKNKEAAIGKDHRFEGPCQRVSIRCRCDRQSEAAPGNDGKTSK